MRGESGDVYENITVRMQNSSDSSGTVAVYYAAYIDALEMIVGTGFSSMGKGNSATLTTLKKANYFSVQFNVAIRSITYNGVAVTYQQTGSGSARPAKIELPANYDNTIPFIFVR